MAYNQRVDNNDRMRELPSVDRLLSHPAIDSLLDELPRSVVVEAVRDVVDSARAAIRSGEIADTSVDALAVAVQSSARAAGMPSLRYAINATGVILHTGLGRAVLAKEALLAISNAADGHSTLEIDLDSGKRGSRQSHVEDLLRKLTGAEAAMVVNNNASAVLLGINSLAAGSEVVISRGQLVEIGGQFRIPDIIESAGCRLVEVGTTNRTRIRDYAGAISEETSLLLRVHPSNFKVVGFTEEASLEEIVELGRGQRVFVMDDLGSGALLDMSRFGVKDEPLVQTSARAGCDLVTFSGDKLLGGPQAGILVGSRHAIELCRNNPLARAVRIDKLCLAALEATLRLYFDPERAMKSIPVLRYIAAPLPELGRNARKLAGGLRKALGQGTDVEVVDCMSQVGGGSLPGQEIPSKGIALRSSTVSAEDLSRSFRRCKTPVIGRIEADRLVLDVRTIEPYEIAVITECAEQIQKGGE